MTVAAHCGAAGCWSCIVAVAVDVAAVVVVQVVVAAAAVVAVDVSVDVTVEVAVEVPREGASWRWSWRLPWNWPRRWPAAQAAVDAAVVVAAGHSTYYTLYARRLKWWRRNLYGLSRQSSRKLVTPIASRRNMPNVFAHAPQFTHFA